MSKTGIKRIGFVEQNEIDDTWHEQQPQPTVRGENEPVIANIHWFGSFDQGNATLSETQVIDGNGAMYQALLDFTVRKDDDMQLANRYAGRPVVIYAEAVDGNTYRIGTKEYPVRMIREKKYDGVTNREISVSVEYDTLTGIL